jgi:hypothetical protein
VSVKMAVFWVVALCCVVEVYQRFEDTCCLHHQGALMMEVANTSETSANFYETTRRHYQEDNHLEVEW